MIYFYTLSGKRFSIEAASMRSALALIMKRSATTYLDRLTLVPSDEDTAACTYIHIHLEATGELWYEDFIEEGGE